MSRTAVAIANDANGASWADLPVATPGLVIDLDVLDRNLDEMAAIARSAKVELFPHAKTHRMAEVGLRQIEHGADGLCVAKLGEAEAFAAAGVKRLFVANPIVGADKAKRALELSRTVDLMLATDSEAAAASIGATFVAAGTTARMMLAIDSGLGREGVTADKAPDVAAAIHAVPGVELVGIYTHEGTTYGAKDHPDLASRARAAGAFMVGVAETIRARGVPLPIVSLGASASAREVAHVPGVTQIRPGIYAFNDVGQIALGNASLDTTAIRVIATVVSHPEPERACIDAGSKSLSTDLVPASAHREDFPGMGLIVNAPGWVIERMSEEHGWLRWHGEGAPIPLPVGMRLEIVPNHVCMAFAMLRRASIVDHGRIVGHWDGFGPGASE
ncbi:MAG: alanine racemase [Devosia sp.]|uniref:alanine racemase n=1 Tax=Devosia sp. TaxID=1871048 RepID=UPI001AD29E45|nr:alanine racemase [Devosia sp.]MBN9316828.1 alanine racemase [Devosia sp.]